MSNKVKKNRYKNRIYYFLNDIINIKNFDPSNIKIDEKSCKNICLLYRICDDIYELYNIYFKYHSTLVYL